MKKTKEVEKFQFVELMRYKKHIRIINKAGGFITRLSAVFYASKGYFKGTFATRILIKISGIPSMSFHHYPDPQAFFDSVKRCLRPNGRLILRDVTSDNKGLVWLMNTLEMPLANICGHGDVRVPTRAMVMKCCKKAGLKVKKFEIRKGMRMHCVVRKPMGKAIGNEE